MALEAPLDRLQRWVQAVVVSPDDVNAAVSSPEAECEVTAADLAEVILPSATLGPEERIGIYQRMYPLRMEEALSKDYPALKHFLGDGDFFDLVQAYVQVHPSRSYTLNRLGDHFPEFVKTASGLHRREFCYDLARLELAVTEVFDAPETPALTAEAIAAVPAEAWERARLTTISAFRLLSFRYPVNAYLQAVRDEDHDHPRTRLKNTWVAVYRRAYSIYRLDLGRGAHDLLADLAGGQRLGEAVAAAAQRRGRRAAAEGDLYRWFRDWMAVGIFSGLAAD